MIVGQRYCEAADISEAWLDALQMMVTVKQRKAVHMTLRVSDPTTDQPRIRSLADRIIDEYNSGRPDAQHLWNVDSTRNTIMPVSWARRHPEPSALAAYYRERYVALRQTPASKFGTYFGRLVAYPRDQKHSNQFDQLSRLVDRLREEHGFTDGKAGGRLSSCYELNVYSERWDTNRISFPCLAHLSLHVHDGRLNMQAVYRNELLIGRAYGNYWGLAELQKYITAAIPTLEPGELLLTLNHVEVDSGVPWRLVKGVLRDAGRAAN